MRASAVASLLGTALILTACARGVQELYGWHALQPGTELSAEQRAGPNGEDVLALLYTVATGRDYAIERLLPAGVLHGKPSLPLWARATRVLHLAMVLVDDSGGEHECALTLLPGAWQELVFDGFEPPVDDWSQIVRIRLQDRTGGLGGQGPVSLKLAGLPLQD
jgi:hypothetical protein